ncbi:DcrB-related protein [Enterobacteriaceae bacterium YMB-R22]|jgi:hypothetical protein|uniref:DcrB-related protein n=1 Tax=Tenebrionicola larvae TaxID=2815733 RepID=UPI002010CDEF|nr:DcrB-related protein [Tenebrionicola larvae]MBV4413080.1 DcrB-related protein [Tenebrionicola larvae]
MEQNSVCPEGTLCPPQGAGVQTINVVVAQGLQNITVTRDRLQPGAGLEGYASGQLAILQQKCREFNLIEKSAFTGAPAFPNVLKMIFTFLAAPDVTVWQYLLVAQKDDENAMLFTSIYASQQMMESESPRIDFCVNNFKLA